MNDAKINAVAVLAAGALAGGLAETSQDASKIALEWYEQLLGEIAGQEERLAAEGNKALGL